MDNDNSQKNPTTLDSLIEELTKQAGKSDTISPSRPVFSTQTPSTPAPKPFQSASVSRPSSPDLPQRSPIFTSPAPLVQPKQDVPQSQPPANQPSRPVLPRIQPLPNQPIAVKPPVQIQPPQDTKPPKSSEIFSQPQADIKMLSGMPEIPRPVPKTAESAPNPIRPSMPAPAAKMPVAPPPQLVKPAEPPAPVLREYKSSIRTMKEDLSDLKKGMAPSGIEIEKTVSPAAVTPPQQAPTPIRPVVPLPSQPQIEARLGEAEKTGRLAPSIGPSISIPRPPVPQPEAKINIPETSSGSNLKIYLLILILILMAGGAYWFLSLRKSEPIAEPTPTETPLPAKNLQTYFPAENALIELPSDATLAADFKQKFNSLAVIAGQFKPLSIINSEKGSVELNLLGLLDNFVVQYPSGLSDAFGSESIILAYGQQEQFDANGLPMAGTGVQNRIIMITQVISAGSFSIALGQWEAGMTDSLSGLFDYNKAKSASQNFNDNTYQNTSIRFKNFPYADKSIDYATVTASNGKLYFIISNSRESMFSAINALHQ